VAWLGWGGTLPSYRGRGAQSAMLAARIEAARHLGCRRLVVETGPDSAEKPNPSYRNVERAGFRVAYLRENWVRTNPAKSADAPPSEDDS
jgi:GNAT superfamily N-acetyltransferase